MRKHTVVAFLLAAGDIVVLYTALASALLLRYGFDVTNPWNIHKTPFGVVFIVWILLFYIAGLYEQNAWSADRTVKERVLRTIAAAGITAAILFYLVPAFVITPKTNLLIHIVFAAMFLIGWRVAASILIRNMSKTNVLFFGITNEVCLLAKTLENNAHLGYNVTALVETEPHAIPTPSSIPVIPFNAELPQFLQANHVSLIITSKEIRSKKEFVKILYNALPLGIRFIDFPTFFETRTGKIPVSLISETWFLENISGREKRVFEVGKRSYDMILAFLIGIPALLIAPFIWITIKLETTGPVLIRQKRVGKNGVPFLLYKFRSMVASGPHGLAETQGAQWADKNDTRITRVGKFLRKTRLDELPQLINIFNGEMSFIGPRPERPEFIETLQQQIPFYEIRHLVRPGLSGWAQINFPYGASVEDAMQKLQYDLYYIKNRSTTLDLHIALKTILVILSHEGR